MICHRQKNNPGNLDFSRLPGIFLLIPTLNPHLFTKHYSLVNTQFFRAFYMDFLQYYSFAELLLSKCYQG